MIVISGIVKVVPGDADAVIELIRPLVAATTAEEGCKSYGFFADPFDKGAFRVFEEWESDEALSAHMSSAHMAAFMGSLGSVTIEGMDIFRYDGAEKKPLFG